MNDLVNRRVLADSIIHAGFASNNVDYPYFRRISDDKVYYLQPQIGYTPLQQGGGAGQRTNKLFIGWSDVGLKLTVDATDMGRIWTEQSFDPGQKANKATSIAGYGITDCYTVTQVNSLVSARVAADSITAAGFAGDNPELPYFRRAATGAVHYLQKHLGYTPLQQGGGANQNPNTLKLGWSNNGAGLRLQVDASDMGVIWGEQNFYRPDNSNFFGIAIEGTSVRLPPGGTWCYSVMHYYLNGNGILGKSGQAPGGTLIQFSGGTTIYGFAWRYAP